MNTHVDPTTIGADADSVALPETPAGAWVFLPNKVVIKLGKQPHNFYGADRFTKEILQTCLEHGLDQKIGDAFAAPKGTPYAERMENVDRVWQQLLDGVWSKRGRSESDPVQRKTREIVLKEFAKLPDWSSLSTDDKKAQLDAFLESDDAEPWYAKAEELIEAEKAAAATLPAITLKL